MSRLLLGVIAFFSIIIVLVLGFSVAAYFFTSGTKSERFVEPAVSAVADPLRTTGRGNLKELLNLFKEPRECQLLFPADSQFKEGTAFVYEGKIRADILDKKGVVISVVSIYTALAVQQKPVVNITQTLIPDTYFSLPVGYSCRPWVVDESVFFLRE